MYNIYHVAPCLQPSFYPQLVYISTSIVWLVVSSVTHAQVFAANSRARRRRAFNVKWQLKIQWQLMLNSFIFFFVGKLSEAYCSWVKDSLICSSLFEAGENWFRCRPKTFYAFKGRGPSSRRINPWSEQVEFCPEKITWFSHQQKHV